ncbi:MAG: metalloregulator ArsR/SmtB family transcription factor [Phycisphaeraceae bacterium]
MIKTAQPDALLGWMDSLADATRLRLLRLLERQEMGVAELCDVVQMPQSTVSRHLKVLADQGWVRNRREGTTNLYQMTLDELEPAARKLWVLAREQTADWSAIEQDQLRLQRVLARRQKDPRAFFDTAAGQWDSLRDELYGRYFSAEALLALLPGHWVVADLGCGTGAMTAQLAGHVRQVIGVDQSPAMLAAARKRIGKARNVELRKGTLEALPLDDEACDAVMLVLVLTYVTDVAAVLAEAARVLKPGGKAVIIDLLRHDREDFRRLMGQQMPGFEPHRLHQLLDSAGLKPLTLAPLPPDTQAKGPALLLATATKP